MLAFVHRFIEPTLASPNSARGTFTRTDSGGEPGDTDVSQGAPVGLPWHASAVRRGAAADGTMTKTSSGEATDTDVSQDSPIALPWHLRGRASQTGATATRGTFSKTAVGGEQSDTDVSQSAGVAVPWHVASPRPVA